MNKHGFTLVELLAVIVIIGLIAGIGIVAYSTIIQNATNETFKKYQDTMHAVAIQYAANNRISFTDNKYKIYLSKLPIDPINNPKNVNDKCLNTGSYVELTKSYSASGVLSISYKVCLNCANSGYSNCTTYEN